MDRILLKELKMKNRKEVLLFLKQLWNEDKVKCPLCSNELELLHKKAKKIIMIGNVKIAIKFSKQCIY